MLCSLHIHGPLSTCLATQIFGVDDNSKIYDHMCYVFLFCRHVLFAHRTQSSVLVEWERGKKEGESEKKKRQHNKKTVLGSGKLTILKIKRPNLLQ